MSIIQKNIFGDNIVYSVSPDFTRQLTPELKDEIISTLRSLNVSSVSIRFEHSSETAEFAGIISHFLQDNGLGVFTNGVMMSEIQRNEFSIQKHPSDPNFAQLKIGTLL
jgi:hypothetical protein